ncbi:MULTISPECIES: YqeG family HAD IIIA-type phosphatase [unclassified Facklamia]|uniref:YqeG family HAD IIIA-type phosphatase n=1 Tax=Aerococcaceae TaxID=186827 RepID=UPI0013B8CEF5|nr:MULTISPECIES: YqeG family HAD IIIA-type phosphatase [unclassified Facklamia]MBS4461638.1 YqeG family HAD IIIA-type phosphatase [Aerococcaceae bacterium zg-B36]NEW63930.1 YqeG family HAD IIIA-type phosphatase [Facklamia sp. 252]NEW67401.1 YqeG family HAD IIIA-type phosphatase [Facklamia sp. 253]QQD65276.1 YqeG family HAD IIIA-type phosphatase [Aerococcaceae bacterium zg-252]
MNLQPKWRINSVYDIQPIELVNRGYRAAIVDLDNTLIASHSTTVTSEMKQWITKARECGLQLYILSNNRERRARTILQPLGLSYTADALKPRKFGFQQALSFFQMPKEKVIVVGDQLLTDLIGAKRMEMDIILVKPLVKKDNVYTWVNRTIERLIYRAIGINRHEDWGNTLE